MAFPVLHASVVWSDLDDRICVVVVAEASHMMQAMRATKVACIQFIPSKLAFRQGTRQHNQLLVFLDFFCSVLWHIHVPGLNFYSLLGCGFQTGNSSAV